MKKITYAFDTKYYYFSKWHDTVFQSSITIQGYTRLL